MTTLDEIKARHERAEKGTPTDCSRERIHADRAWLLAAFDEYAQHKRDCMAKRRMHIEGAWPGEPPCTCGLSEIEEVINHE